MLSKAVQVFRQAHNKKALGNMMLTNARAFSHGPYNPLHYKSHLVPEQLPR